MRQPLLPPLGEALRKRRRERNLTQLQLATRLGRSAPRISELEKELLSDRIGRDRLGLLAQLCDALDLVPILIPAERAAAVAKQLGVSPRAPAAGASRVFEDVFVDLSDDEDDD